MGCSERQKEIKRRRHRRKRITEIEARSKKASASEKQVLAGKLRALTPGADELIKRFGLEK